MEYLTTFGLWQGWDMALTGDKGWDMALTGWQVKWFEQ